jgi:class 3 adenylate cyclase
MNESEARDRLEKYLIKISGDTNYRPPEGWQKRRPEARQLQDGRWLFTFVTPPPVQGVIVSPDAEPTPFWGALGKVVPIIGLPRSRELFLCSTIQGRYQLYEQGIAIWEAGPDVGYPIPSAPEDLVEGKRTQAIVAFVDIRGFTAWSAAEGRTEAEVQQAVRTLESSFQEAFSKAWCHKLFTKGTGDGLMIVSEAGWAEDCGAAGQGLQRKHAALFALSCAELIIEASKRLPESLAVGCGINFGSVTRVFLLGRQDYIGATVNDASKIQQLGWNEMCVSDTYRSALEEDVRNLKKYKLAGKGWRLDSSEVLATVRAMQQTKKVL